MATSSCSSVTRRTEPQSIQGLEKDADSGMWIPTYMSTYDVKKYDEKLASQMESWEEMGDAYFLPEADQIVMSEALGPAYQVQLPKTIDVEASR